MEQDMVEKDGIIIKDGQVILNSGEKLSIEKGVIPYFAIFISLNFS